MADVTQVLTHTKKITEQKLVTVPSAPLANGQARLRIERFALTANNVTYAASGFAIGYWKFFPTTEDGWGLVPVWGFAEVVEMWRRTVWICQWSITSIPVQVLRPRTVILIRR